VRNMELLFDLEGEPLNYNVYSSCLFRTILIVCILCTLYDTYTERSMCIIFSSCDTYWDFYQVILTKLWTLVVGQVLVVTHAKYRFVACTMSVYNLGT
jgi:hypothetical protein